MNEHIDAEDDEPLEPPLPAVTREERIDAILGVTGDEESRRLIGAAIDAVDKGIAPGSGDLRNYRLRQSSKPPSFTLGRRSSHPIYGWTNDEAVLEADRREAQRVREVAAKHSDAGDAELTALRARLRSDPAFLAEFPIMRDGLCHWLGVDRSGGTAS